MLDNGNQNEDEQKDRIRLISWGRLFSENQQMSKNVLLLSGLFFSFNIAKGLPNFPLSPAPLQ